MRRHESVVQAIRRSSRLVSPNASSVVPPLQFTERGEIAGASSNLTPILAEGWKGSVTYGPRHERAANLAMNDDTLILECDTARVKYSVVVNEVFPQLIAMFSAYRAAIILDDDLDIDDYERVVALHEQSGLDIDGRDTILRVNPVSYFDRMLCDREFGLSPESIVRLLEDQSEHVSILLDGVLLIMTSAEIERAQVEEVDARVRSILTK